METLGQIIAILKLLPLRVWVGLSFMPLMLVFTVALIRADLSSSSTFRLIHFATSDAGRGSYYALGYTLFVITYVWGFFALIMLDKWSTEYLAVGGGLLIVGSLGGTAARVVAKVKGATTEPDAGDAGAEPAPAFERETNIKQVERGAAAEAPANPLAPKTKARK